MDPTPPIMSTEACTAKCSKYEVSYSAALPTLAGNTHPLAYEPAKTAVICGWCQTSAGNLLGQLIHRWKEMHLKHIDGAAPTHHEHPGVYSLHSGQRNFQQCQLWGRYPVYAVHLCKHGDSGQLGRSAR